MRFPALLYSEVADEGRQKPKLFREPRNRDDIDDSLRHVLLSQTAICLHQHKTDHLRNTALQPSMPKLPLNLIHHNAHSSK